MIYSKFKFNFYIVLNLIENKLSKYIIKIMGIGDWGLGIGDWGFGVWAQNPNPKTQNPKPKTQNNFLF